MSLPIFHIVRGNLPIGQFSNDQIRDMYETGQLLPGDKIFLEQTRAWLPLKDWMSLPVMKTKEDSQESNDSDVAKDLPSHERRRRKLQRNVAVTNHRRPRHIGAILGGWVIAFFSLIIAIVFGIWGYNLSSDLQAAHKKDAFQKEQIDMLKKENQTLLEPIPARQIKGILIHRDNKSRSFPIPGLPVSLFPRKEIETLLSTQQTEPPPNSATDFSRLAKKIHTLLPKKPFAATLTDANGRFHLKDIEPADYVIYAFFPNTDTPSCIWLQAVSVTDSYSRTLILSTDKAISYGSFFLQIIEPPIR